MRLWPNLRALFRRRTLDAEMAEELRLHLELQREQNIARGMNPDEARYTAQREFGNIGALQQQLRDQRGWRWLDELIADVRFAVRMLGKHPGFTAVAVLTLALGIGFVTTLFTMINGVAFSQLPFEHAEQIVSIDVPATRFDDYAMRQRSCSVFGFVDPVSANLRAGSFVSRYSAARVSTNLLELLRVRPEIGRGFLPEDAAAGASRTVLISHSVWQQEFARASDVIGQEVKINGESHVVIGVMPEGFGFPFNQELWIGRRTADQVGGGIVLGRLRDDVSGRQASDEFTVLTQALGPDPTGGSRFVWNADVKAKDGGGVTRVEVVPFSERSVKQALRLMLSAILGATFLVLLLACSNVTNLVLARAVDRRKEMAVRSSLGASRARLIRQMLTESSIIVLLGAAGGLLIAMWSTQCVWAYMMKERPLTGGAPYWMNFDLDGRVFGFVVVVSLFATVLTGLIPALQASRVNLNDALKDGSGAGLRLSRFTRGLINVQMAFSVCLVTVAGLFVTVLISFNHKTLPYDPTAILTARISLEERRYDDAAVRVRLFQDLIDRLATSPDITAAALTSSESIRLRATSRIFIEGATYARASDQPECFVETVSPEFVTAYGVRVLSGRAFDGTDVVSAPAVSVVNTAFVERFSPGRDILGQRVRLGGDTAAWTTVIGVIPDLGSVKAGQASHGAVMYRPLAQTTERAMTVLMRGRVEVSRLASTLRTHVSALDPELPVAKLQTIQEIVELERIGMNAFGVLFVVCGVGALLLASVGLYGVISFAVKLRTRELGIRMALGAERGTISRMVFGQGVRQISIGLGVGILLAIGASAILSSMFVGFGKSGYDTVIYVGVLTLLAGVSGAALMIPARRAATVDPMVALRAE